ncbi:MAG: adenine phosphoribosyltransferase [Candidatus Aminicenantes bacterium]|nr:adenine phosphoribosyltransferase [Candidatus Aminicenantes bacterium]
MIDKVKERIREVKDFPKPGIGFKDITPLIEDAGSFHHVIDLLAEWAEKLKPDIIAGIESRGFIFAAPVAYQLKLGLALIRKKGKLPYKTVGVRAPNEYAVENFEMHIDSVDEGQRVVVIDDLIATGSSSISAVDLVKKLGGIVIGFGVLVDLEFLKGVEAIRKAHPDTEILSLIKFNE